MGGIASLQRAGKIRELERQVSFELIPAHYEEIYTGEFYKRGARMGEPKKERKLMLYLKGIKIKEI